MLAALGALWVLLVLLLGLAGSEGNRSPGASFYPILAAGPLAVSAVIAVRVHNAGTPWGRAVGRGIAVSVAAFVAAFAIGTAALWALISFS